MTATVMTATHMRGIAWVIAVHVRGIEWMVTAADVGCVEGMVTTANMQGIVYVTADMQGIMWVPTADAKGIAMVTAAAITVCRTCYVRTVESCGNDAVFLTSKKRYDCKEA